MHNLQIAIIIVVTFLIVCHLTQKSLNGNKNSLVQKIIDDTPNGKSCTNSDCAGGCGSHKHAKDLPIGSMQSFMTAQSGNTLEQRPGSTYSLEVLPESKVPPAFTVILLYTPDSEKHQLCMIFRHIRSQMNSDETSSNYNIDFKEDIVPQDVSDKSGLPKVVKVRRNGQLLEYKGYTDYGQLSDFILNEGLLFS